MRRYLVFVPTLAGLLFVAGCRFKGVESFEKSTTPVNYAKQDAEYGVKGDPYMSGGIAYASAAHQTKTRYGQGANVQSTSPVDPKLDRPAKGSGQQPGEEGGDAAPGYGHSNAPANQPAPTVDSVVNH
ncbi:MAG: hypothetical protein P4L46_18645 [Fimbriimonas sp.]|nr:hypothetical protein [Fimbriimonas sp.]